MAENKAAGIRKQKSREQLRSVAIRAQGTYEVDTLRTTRCKSASIYRPTVCSHTQLWWDNRYTSCRYTPDAKIRLENVLLDKENEPEGTNDNEGEINFWKALALTKKEKLDITVKIPQRMFLNDAPEVREAIEKATIEQIAKLFNNI